jgi:hypothetical protein
LNVTTLENPSLTINLSNPLVKDDFVSWRFFEPLPQHEHEEVAALVALTEPAIEEPLTT